MVTDITHDSLQYLKASELSSIPAKVVVLFKLYNRSLCCVMAIGGKAADQVIEWDQVAVLILFIHCFLDKIWIIIGAL